MADESLAFSNFLSALSISLFLLWAESVVGFWVHCNSGALFSVTQTAHGEHLPMDPIPCLTAATLLLSIWLCGAHSPTCPKIINVKVGDNVEISSCSTSAGITDAYWKHGRDEKIVDKDHVKETRFKHRVGMNKTTFNLILSGLTLQDSGQFGFFSSVESTQMQTLFFNLSVYEAITNINARKINSTWDSVTNQCEIWLECNTLQNESGDSVNYTWAIRNETHTGATFKYVTTEGEDTGKCTAANPVSEKSTSTQVECRNVTLPEVQRTAIPQIWIYISTGLGVLVLLLILVFVCGLRRRKSDSAAPESMDAVYDSIENVQRKETTSKDEPYLGPLYELVQNVEARPPQQQTAGTTIYYTVQQSRLMDPPS